MKTYGLAWITVLAITFSGCCHNYHGYGRYQLRPSCDTVEIDGEIYEVEMRGNEPVLDSHTLDRGIYRKTRPWLYVHGIGDSVDVTFESGLEPSLPLSTGSSQSISNVFDQPAEILGTTSAAFPDDYWLVSHRWSGDGFFFDLHQRLADDRRWRLVQGDIFIDGSRRAILNVEEFGVIMDVDSLDAENRQAEVEFESTRLCCAGDSPSCACFDATGAWDPSGPWIQDIGLATVGTTESCPAGKKGDRGKAYYQMQLGYSSPAASDFHACRIAELGGARWPVEPQAWCSEAVSYWHLKAGIPYPGGFRNGGWLLSWNLPDTEAIRTFYLAEEHSGGRGRWIGWNELDYSDFRPGENAPVPGSYVLIRKYDGTNWGGYSHSLMINEMTVYRTAGGEVVRVEISMIEGNALPAVWDGRVFDDMLAVTPAGDTYIGGSRRKILGFGVDLDAAGNPVFDPDRLHYVEVPAPTPAPRALAAPRPRVDDPTWEAEGAPLVDALARYGTRLRREGGPAVRSAPSPVAQAEAKSRDTEAGGLQEFEVDLRDVHPLPVKGIILAWAGEDVPETLELSWAGSDGIYHRASRRRLVAPAGVAEVPVYFQLDESGAGVGMRLLRVKAPAGALSRGTLLDQLTFLYDWGPDTDAPAGL